MGIEILTPRRAELLRLFQHSCFPCYLRPASDVLTDPEFCDQVKAMLRDIDVGNTPEFCQWLLRDQFWPWLLRGDKDFLLKLALHSKETSKVVQKLIKAADPITSAKLASKLAPHTVALYESPHGNFVLSVAIQSLPPYKFVEEIKNKGSLAVAKHRFGCRACIKLVEYHCLDEADDADVVVDVLNEFAAGSLELARHPNGRHVVQALHHHGQENRKKQVHHKARVESHLRERAPGLAMHRQGSWVVQEMLSLPESPLLLARTLVEAEAPSIAEIAAARYGSYVVLELLNLICEDMPCNEDALKLGLELRERLRGAPVGSRHFRRVAERLGAMDF